MPLRQTSGNTQEPSGQFAPYGGGFQLFTSCGQPRSSGLTHSRSCPSGITFVEDLGVEAKDAAGLMQRTGQLFLSAAAAAPRAATPGLSLRRVRMECDDVELPWVASATPSTSSLFPGAARRCRSLTGVAAPARSMSELPDGYNGDGAVAGHVAGARLRVPSFLSKVTSGFAGDRKASSSGFGCHRGGLLDDSPARSLSRPSSQGSVRSNVSLQSRMSAGKHSDSSEVKFPRADVCGRSAGSSHSRCSSAGRSSCSDQTVCSSSERRDNPGVGEWPGQALNDDARSVADILRLPNVSSRITSPPRRGTQRSRLCQPAAGDEEYRQLSKEVVHKAMRLDELRPQSRKGPADSRGAASDANARAIDEAVPQAVEAAGKRPGTGKKSKAWQTSLCHSAAIHCPKSLPSKDLFAQRKAPRPVSPAPTLAACSSGAADANAPAGQFSRTLVASSCELWSRLEGLGARECASDSESSASLLFISPPIPSAFDEPCAPACYPSALG
eukprot:TRINITY_DN42166_c0_g1_i1.p1 TRINITY_DN42166_c0_g1~~TRINITY_DN42166_c0_g1_i1.p1  ORF type:complete len:499 (-),score=49.14 TRINITY_DN42166_c0_g1_i1:42-1538(-)